MLLIQIKMLMLTHFETFIHKEVEEVCAKKHPKPKQQTTTKLTQAVVFDVMFTISRTMDLITFPRRQVPFRSCSTNELEGVFIWNYAWESVQYKKGKSTQREDPSFAVPELAGNSML